MRVLGRVSRFTAIRSLGNGVHIQLAKLLAVRALSLSLSLSQSVSLGGVAREPAERNRVGYTLSPDIRLNISLHPSNLWTASQARSRY